MDRGLLPLLPVLMLRLNKSFPNIPAGPQISSEPSCSDQMSLSLSIFARVPSPLDYFRPSPPLSVSVSHLFVFSYTLHGVLALHFHTSRLSCWAPPSRFPSLFALILSQVTRVRNNKLQTIEILPGDHCQPFPRGALRMRMVKPLL